MDFVRNSTLSFGEDDENHQFGLNADAIGTWTVENASDWLLDNISLSPLFVTSVLRQPANMNSYNETLHVSSLSSTPSPRPQSLLNLEVIAPMVDAVVFVGLLLLLCCISLCFRFSSAARLAALHGNVAYAFDPDFELNPRRRVRFEPDV